MKVLVIDDEAMIRSLAEKILKRGGYEVITAESGEAALQVLADNGEIDGVLLDLNMPGLSGLETLRKIRETHQDIPCVLSSGHPAETYDIDQELAVRTTYLEKPYRAQVLIEKVDELLK
ncbi:response regulator [candidate division GN15 bacterium]|nr:response regulator [candidate division GN15 bacterium]